MSKIEIGTIEGTLDFYLNLANNLDGSLKRMYIHGPRSDSDMRCFLAGISELVNLCLDEGILIEKIINRLLYIGGETAGLTNREEVRSAKSVLDAVGKMLKARYLEES